MSRNLGEISCTFCYGKVTLDESPRPITREECAGYYDTREGYGYAGAIVANATCEDCKAKYLAHVDFSACTGYGSHSYFHKRDDQPFFDLSHRSTFNDEPYPDDMPDEIIVRKTIIAERRPWPRCAGCGEKALCKNPKPGDYCPTCWSREHPR